MRIKLSDHFTYTKLLRYVFPSIIMMVFTSIYSVVDGLFVSNFVGKTAFAALNLVVPFLMILGGTSFMIGTGGSALVARELGTGNKRRANQYFTMMVVFTIGLGVLLTVFGLIVLRPVCYLMGATDMLIEDCMRYGRIVLFFTPAFMLQSAFQSFLAAAEKPKLGLMITVAAGITNAILDGVFIAGFGWGLAGAALATGIGQCVGGIIPLIYFIKPNSSLLRVTKTRMEWKPLVKACTNGSSELMSNISTSLISILYNIQLMRLIGEDGVSAFGVLMYVQFVFTAISIGYSIGSMPIVSYHYGAENHGELKNLLKKSILIMCSTGAFLTVLGLVLSKTVAQIFVGYDPELFALTRHAFVLFVFSFPLAGLNIFASGFFTALNDGGVSAAISFLRTLVLQSGAVLLLPFLLGADGLWCAMTAAEFTACFVSAAFLLAKKKKYHYFS